MRDKMRNFRRSSKGQILLMSAIIVCILLFAVGGFLADASRRRPPRESEDIYFVFANIKAETSEAGKYALNANDSTYISEWCDSVNKYIEELGYSGSLDNPRFDDTEADFVLIIQSSDTIIQDRFTVTDG